MSSKPINIPSRSLSSSKPPQKNPFSPPNSFPKVVSSFDMYCGHIENNEMLRKNWKKKVESFTGDEKKQT